jgi:hypothetical protein
LLNLVGAGKTTELAESLVEEEKRERERDRIYWQPLRAELELFRRQRQGDRTAILAGRGQASVHNRLSL